MVSPVAPHLHSPELTIQHGIKRTKLSPQAAEAKRVKEQGKIATYTGLEHQVLERVSAGRGLHIYLSVSQSP